MNDIDSSDKDRKNKVCNQSISNQMISNRLITYFMPLESLLLLCYRLRVYFPCSVSSLSCIFRFTNSIFKFASSISFFI